MSFIINIADTHKTKIPQPRFQAYFCSFCCFSCFLSWQRANSFFVISVSMYFCGEHTRLLRAMFSGDRGLHFLKNRSCSRRCLSSITIVLLSLRGILAGPEAEGLGVRGCPVVGAGAAACSFRYRLLSSLCFFSISCNICMPSTPRIVWSWVICRFWNSSMRLACSRLDILFCPCQCHNRTVTDDSGWM